MVAPKETQMELELELGAEMELKLALEPATSRVLLSMLASGRGGSEECGVRRSGKGAQWEQGCTVGCWRR